MYFLAKWHGIKTKHTCRFGESEIGRTSGGWKFPELTSLRSVSSGNFQPPSVRPIPDSPPCKYVYYKASDRLTEAELRPIFTSLCFLDMETFFYHENQRDPPSLSQFGKLRSVLKSDLLYHVLKGLRMFNQKITHLLKSLYLTVQLLFACSSLWHQKMLKSAVERLLSHK